MSLKSPQRRSECLLHFATSLIKRAATSRDLRREFPVILPFDGTAIEGIADLAFLEEQAPNLRLVFDITGFPSISLANERDRRDPRRSRTPGEQISLQHGCFLSVRIVHQTRASNSAQITAGGTGGSNPPLSATQSVLFTYNLEMAEICARRGACALDANRRARTLRAIRQIPRVFLHAQKSRFASPLEPIRLIYHLGKCGGW
jgi:hypothetical protein